MMNVGSKMTLEQVAREDPTFTFSLFYDVWDHPGSSHREQACLKDISATELAEKYGSFILDGWYTTSRNPDRADVWATATEPRFLYKNVPEVYETKIIGSPSSGYFGSLSRIDPESWHAPKQEGPDANGETVESQCFFTKEGAERFLNSQPDLEEIRSHCEEQSAEELGM